MRNGENTKSSPRRMHLVCALGMKTYKLYMILSSHIAYGLIVLCHDHKTRRQSSGIVFDELLQKDLARHK